jgi:hypothetical protein
MKRFRVCGHWLSRVNGSARLRGFAAFGVVAALVVLAVQGLALTLAALHGDPAMPAAQRASAAQHSAAEPAARGRVLDSFFQEELRTERFWRKLQPDGNRIQRRDDGVRWSSPPRDGFFSQRPWRRNDDDDDDDDDDRSGTYRTVCVRLCDGYYWPMSFATSPESFAGDAVACQRSCNSPARLFVYRNPGEEPEQMVDLSGRPYARLDSAFRYRTTYDAACQCRPEPWSQEAQDRHRMYALQAERRKGNRAVDQEIATLKAKQTAARQAAASVERQTETRSDGEPIMRLGVQRSGEGRSRRSRSSGSD